MSHAMIAILYIDEPSKDINSYQFGPASITIVASRCTEDHLRRFGNLIQNP
jgi:hypothetical protein